jgi:tetrahydromethanopterin S-methyltransferase subunit F
VLGRVGRHPEQPSGRSPVNRTISLVIGVLLVIILVILILRLA